MQESKCVSKSVFFFLFEYPNPFLEYPNPVIKSFLVVLNVLTGKVHTVLNLFKVQIYMLHYYFNH